MQSLIEHIPDLLKKYTIDLDQGSWNGEIELEFKQWCIRFTAIIMADYDIYLGDWFNQTEYELKNRSVAIINLEAFMHDEPIVLKTKEEEEIINTLIDNLK